MSPLGDPGGHIAAHQLIRHMLSDPVLFGVLFPDGYGSTTLTVNGRDYTVTIPQSQENPVNNTALLAADARNRAARALVIGLLIDVGLALAVAIGTALTSLDITDGQAWAGLAILAGKTVTQATGSYLLRRFADQSRFPTPLPPSPVPNPTDPIDPEAADGTADTFE